MFKQHTDPEFNISEVWVSSSGSKVSIRSIKQYPIDNPGKWDWMVEYMLCDGTIHTKDGWNFQVRYTHSSQVNKS